MSNHALITVNPNLKIEQLVKEIIKQPHRQIILKVPENTLLLTNEINLRLIKFYAEDEAKDLIISTVDSQLVALAQRLGISTIRERNLDVAPKKEEEPTDFTNPEVTPRLPEGAYKSRKPKKKYHWKHHGFFPAVVAALCALLIGLWFFFQPKVLVVVYPKEQKLNFGAKVIVNSHFKDEEILGGKIPAKTVAKTTEFTVETVTTGAKVIGIAPATGVVILINRSNQPVVIPQGTVLIGTNGIRFRTVKNVLAPKKSTRLRYGIPVGEEYGKVEVAIIAEQKGAQGNLPVKSITKIVGKLQNYLQVVNLKPTVNGADRRIAVVAPADVEKGTTEATRQMRLTAVDELAVLVDAGYLFFPELVNVQALTLRSSPPVAGEATTLKTVLKYKATVVAPSLAGIHKYLASCLESNLPPNFKTTNEAVKLVSAQVLTADTPNVQLHLVGAANLRGVLSPSKVRELIKGKSIGEAKKLLTQQNEVADFTIETDPGRNTLPKFGFQIKLLFPSGPKNRVRL
jgi:hypothetical protein